MLGCLLSLNSLHGDYMPRCGGTCISCISVRYSKMTLKRTDKLNGPQYLVTARRMGKVMFLVCSPRGGGYPSQVPSPFPRLWSRVLFKGVPQFLVPCPFREGIPSLWSHVPSRGVPQSCHRSCQEGTPRTPHPPPPPTSQNWSTPPPFSQDWGASPRPGTGYSVGGMPRAVSHRTFLFLIDNRCSCIA